MKLSDLNNNDLDILKEGIEVLIGDPIVRGMAIEVSRLSEEDRGLLIDWLNCRAVTTINAASKNENGVNYVSFYDSFAWGTKHWYTKNGYTITESPVEFMQYVSKQTGKEYIRDLTITPEIREKIQQKIKDRLAGQTYPHKAYRILDSLDGIPLDKRIPLSEWIPPFGKEVLWIFNDSRFFSELDRIGSHGITVSAMNNIYLPLSGHWMRIV